MDTGSTTTRGREEVLAISPAAFTRIAEFIHRELGIRMSRAKIPLLQSRLQRRLRVLGCDSLETYLTTILQSPEGEDEVFEFIDAITTNKTDFLREPAHFDLLRTVALPALQASSPAPLQARVWSAGCSTGQEVYTLAMVLSEHTAEQGGRFDFRITGTDISRRVLEAAATAIYDAALVEPLPQSWRRKYLLRSRDTERPRVRVVPELRAKVDLQRLNFMNRTYDLKETFDVIFFRNVMIYFDKQTQEQVVNRMCERLRPGGYMFIGHSESLTGLSVPLRNLGNAMFRKEP